MRNELRKYIYYRYYLLIDGIITYDEFFTHINGMLNGLNMVDKDIEEEKEILKELKKHYEGIKFKAGRYLSIEEIETLEKLKNKGSWKK